jgi:cytochrome c-type biogenesis protein CcmH
MDRAERLHSPRRAWRTAALLAVALWAAASCWAGEAAPASDDPVLEARVMKLSAELRCLVCQNQTIADSHADLAVDLRNQVREMMQSGRSDKEIMNYMTARYGDFVLYRPPLKETTALLWFGPPLLLVGGVAVLWAILRRRSRMSADRFEPDADDEAAAPSPGDRPPPAPRSTS